MKKYFLGLFAISALSTNIYACSANGCYNVTVDLLYIADNGDIYIGTSGDESLLECTSPGDYLLTINTSVPSKNAMYSALLTAQTTNKKVFIRAHNSSPVCEIAYIKLYK